MRFTDPEILAFLVRYHALLRKVDECHEHFDRELRETEVYPFHASAMTSAAEANLAWHIVNHELLDLYVGTLRRASHGWMGHA